MSEEPPVPQPPHSTRFSVVEALDNKVRRCVYNIFLNTTPELFFTFLFFCFSFFTRIIIIGVKNRAYFSNQNNNINNMKPVAIRFTKVTYDILTL